MTHLTKEQLHDLTARISERLAEFDDRAMPALSPGIVRLVHSVIAEWQAEQIVPAPKSPFNDDKFCQPFDLEEHMPKGETIVIRGDELKNAPTAYPAPELTPAAVSALGPEHVVVTPLKTNGNGHHKPRTIAELDLDNDLIDIALGSEEKAALLREIIGELQMLSRSGEMPAMAEWDERKPDHLPKAPAICARYKLNWGRLAEYARLTFHLDERRGRRHKEDKE